MPKPLSISGREFFIRLAQELTDVLGRITAEGPAFRIDLRLRPRGNEGELAIQLSRALQYYGEVAHDWELQALIKVRHSAGDQQLARRFIRKVQPFVYRGEINFRAIETALDSLHKIKKHPRRGIARRRLAPRIDVKLDRGGIRDIEFLVQCLQRVYGGAEPWLHSGGTLFSLQKLHDKEHLSGNDFHILSASYTFLRQVEHRLQIWLGQQTHTLPADEWQLQAIQRSLVAETPDREPRPARRTGPRAHGKCRCQSMSASFISSRRYSGRRRLCPLKSISWLSATGQNRATLRFWSVLRSIHPACLLLPPACRRFAGGAQLLSRR